MLFNGLFAGFGAPGIVYGIIDRLLSLSQNTAAPQFIEPQTTMWPHFIGTYLGMRGGLATIVQTDGQLQLDLNGDNIPLRALKSDLYVGLNTQGDVRVSVGFIPEEEGPLQWITVNGMPFRRFARDTSFVPDPTIWLAYVGTYEAVNDSFKVRIEDGQLLLLVPPLPCV